MENNLYKRSWEVAKSYSKYRELIDDLLEKNKTTGPDQSEAMVAYAAMNQQRMKRIEKTFQAHEEIIVYMANLATHVKWLVITEGWCGDAAQSLPVMAAIASAAGVEMRVVLRDENIELIDAHLTNGGRSIPILLVLNEGVDKVLASWGPRPEALQDMVIEYKAAPEPKPTYADFQKDVHLWYARDKQQAIQQALVDTNRIAASKLGFTRI